MFVPPPSSHVRELTPRRRVHILGGGIAGLTAALELTDTPALRARHDVTVHQLGWRLGGKLSSGRAGAEARNLEHGLHGWFGFYDNAFDLLKRVYSEWKPDPRCAHQRWQDVVRPHRHTPFGDFFGESWDFHSVLWPLNDQQPGSGGKPVTLAGLVNQLLAGIAARRAPAEFPQGAGSMPFARAIDRIVGLAERLEGHSSLFTSALEGVFRRFADHVRSGLAGQRPMLGARRRRALHTLLRRLTDHLRRAIDPHLLSDARRFDWYVAEFWLTVACVLLDPRHDVLAHADLDRLNHLELREALREQGATKTLLDSPMVRVCYSAAFQNPEGRREDADIEAGTGLRIILRLGLGYRGAVMYGLVGSTGDTVIAPLYEVLKARGVKFEFFHRVSHLSLSESGDRVARIDIDVQAELVDDTYDPLIHVHHAPCWPAKPRWEQLRDGEVLDSRGVDFESHWCAQPAHRTLDLHVDKDFDDVILALPLGAFKPLNEDPSICQALIEHNPRFRAMVEGIPLVPSIAVQLWMTPDLRGLGFRAVRPQERSDPPAMVEAPGTLDIWADMSSVLAAERWPAPGPGSLHYLCSVWPSALYRAPRGALETPSRARADALAATREWLEQVAPLLWPAAADDGSFNWRMLHDPLEREGPERLLAQYVRANVSPGECCSASPAGKGHLRLCAHESGYDNLLLAGAWTRTVLNIESVEGAVSSGRFAARALMGADFAIPGEHFLHRPRPAEPRRKLRAAPLERVSNVVAAE